MDCFHSQSVKGIVCLCICMMNVYFGLWFLWQNSLFLPWKLSRFLPICIQSVLWASKYTQSSFRNIVLNLLFPLLCFLLRCQLLSTQLRFGWTLPMHHCKTVVLYFIPIPAAHPILWERLLCIYQQGSNNCGLVFVAS